MKRIQRGGAEAAVKLEHREAMVLDAGEAVVPAPGADDEAALLAAALGGDAAVAVDATTLERGVEEEVSTREEEMKKKLAPRRRRRRPRLNEFSFFLFLSLSLTLRRFPATVYTAGRATPRRGEEEGSLA